MASRYSVLANIKDEFPEITNVTIILDKKHQSLYAIQSAVPGLFKYSFHTNSWLQYKLTISSSNDWYHPYDITAAIDEDHQKIYLCFGAGNLASIASITLCDNKEATMDIINDFKGDQTGISAQGIMVKNEFHLIGGTRHHHIKYNPNTNDTQVLQEYVSSNDLDLKAVSDHKRHEDKAALTANSL